MTPCNLLIPELPPALVGRTPSSARDPLVAPLFASSRLPLELILSSLRLSPRLRVSAVNGKLRHD
jgi:hypothetical protein